MNPNLHPPPGYHPPGTMLPPSTVSAQQQQQQQQHQQQSRLQTHASASTQHQTPPRAPSPRPPPQQQPAAPPPALTPLQVAHKTAATRAADDNRTACDEIVDAPFRDLDDAIARLLPYNVYAPADEDDMDRGRAEPDAEEEENGEGGEDAKTEGGEAKTEAKTEVKTEVDENGDDADDADDDAAKKKRARRAAPRPPTSRAAAWDEMMATFARDFESDFEAKRARHERFVKDLTRTEGLRVEEAYLVEAMTMEEVKRRR